MSNWWASSRGRACLKKRQEICISWAARAAVDHRAVAFPHRAKFVKYVLIVKYFCSVFVIWNYLAYVFLVLTVQYLNELSSKKRLLDCITINHPLSFSLLETPTSSPVEQLGVSLTWQPPKHRSTVNAGHKMTRQQNAFTAKFTEVFSYRRRDEDQLPGSRTWSQQLFCHLKAFSKVAVLFKCSFAQGKSFKRQKGCNRKLENKTTLAHFLKPWSCNKLSFLHFWQWVIWKIFIVQCERTSLLFEWYLKIKM